MRWRNNSGYKAPSVGERMWEATQVAFYGAGAWLTGMLITQEGDSPNYGEPIAHGAVWGIASVYAVAAGTTAIENLSESRVRSGWAAGISAAATFVVASCAAGVIYQEALVANETHSVPVASLTGIMIGTVAAGLRMANGPNATRRYN